MEIKYEMFLIVNPLLKNLSDNIFLFEYIKVKFFFFVFKCMPSFLSIFTQIQFKWNYLWNLIKFRFHYFAAETSKNHYCHLKVILDYLSFHFQDAFAILTYSLSYILTTNLNKSTTSLSLTHINTHKHLFSLKQYLPHPK